MPDPGDDETPPRRPGPRRKTIQAPSGTLIRLTHCQSLAGTAVRWTPIMPAVKGDIGPDNVLYHGGREGKTERPGKIIAP
jgi:hypothetical protein